VPDTGQLLVNLIVGIDPVLIESENAVDMLGIVLKGNIDAGPEGWRRQYDLITQSLDLHVSDEILDVFGRGVVGGDCDPWND
jgi:hypothetical protein